MLGVEPYGQAPASPAKGEQSQGRAELGGEQGATQSPLQAHHGAGTRNPIGLQLADPTGPQLDQGELTRCEEGQQQYEKNRQDQQGPGGGKKGHGCRGLLASLALASPEL